MQNRRKGINRSAGVGLPFVELAAVLLIVGLIVGGIIFFLGPVLKNSRRSQSVKTVKQAADAITGFVRNNNRLPRPEELPVLVRNVDAWGGTLMYFPDPGLTSSGLNLCCPGASGFDVKDNGVLKKETAFLVLSEGKNHANDTGGSPVFNIQKTGRGYDDITEYVSLAGLRKALGCRPIEITSDNPASGEEGYYYSSQFSAKASCVNPASPGLVWEKISGDLPPGLILQKNGYLRGKIGYGQPGASGCSDKYAFIIQVTDAAGLKTQKEFSMEVLPRRLSIVSDRELPAGLPGTPYRAELEAKNGRLKYSWKISSGELPAGLSLSAHGVISGTPQATSSGRHRFTAELTDGCRTASKTFTLFITDRSSQVGAAAGGCPPLTLSEPPVINVDAGTAFFSRTISVSGGQPPYRAGKCINNCAGLNLVLGCTSTNATISGSPVSPGACTFSVKWQDSCPGGSQSTTGYYTVKVQGAGAPPQGNSGQ